MWCAGFQNSICFERMSYRRIGCDGVPIQQDCADFGRYSGQSIAGEIGHQSPTLVSPVMSQFGASGSISTGRSLDIGGTSAGLFEDQAASDSVLAHSRDLDGSKISVRRNVRRTRFVDANFDCRRVFAEHLVKNSVTLVILEGQLHPDVMTVYSTEFRKETRRRLTEMATEIGFEHVSEWKLLHFDSADFWDGYHLNDRGRDKMTLALARLLRKRPLAATTSQSIQQMERP